MKKTTMFFIVLLAAVFVPCISAPVPALADTPVTIREPFIRDLQLPVGMLYDGEGSLYIAEWAAGRVCKYDSKGRRTLVTEEVAHPSGLAMDEDGRLFIASYNEGIIYMFEEGRLRRFVSGFNVPAGILWHDGILYVANRDAGEIVRVSPVGRKDVLSKGHHSPVGIARFDDGSLVISCLGGLIQRLWPDGRVTTVSDALKSPAPGIVRDGAGAVIAADYGGTRIARITLDGVAETVADGFSTPVGLVRRPDGGLVVAAWGDAAAFKVEPGISGPSDSAENKL
ncbi:hypothetical protein [Cloacibacillus evryensis]|uniref:Vgb family protein n=1 Tax=Cloacibacillus evryensis TaxID=508460 RepID=UPI00044A5308|nr:hypothetical protein [Cloacibacillus evryensis]EXG78185.1 hypothetical protein Cloev_0293 [Cloacibacillus evryensis DSM 19522]MCQ4762687.1 hypothetical protein [Cloacibacillus evryensis]MEA5035857.1 hypothetical protein [Cloacibacillus evryensis]